MPVKLNSSGGGSVTLDVPATTTAVTLNLPVINGTVVAGDGSNNVAISGNLSFNSGYGSAAVGYGCRAWVNFNGTGTVAIRASGNVSSITDNGTSNYTANFTNAMPDVNFAASMTSSNNESVADAYVFVGQGSIRTTSSYRFTVAFDGAGNPVDRAIVNLAIFR